MSERLCGHAWSALLDSITVADLTTEQSEPDNGRSSAEALINSVYLFAIMPRFDGIC
jgi:hypothetical protein